LFKFKLDALIFVFAEAIDLVFCRSPPPELHCCGRADVGALVGRIVGVLLGCIFVGEEVVGLFEGDAELGLFEGDAVLGLFEGEAVLGLFDDASVDFEVGAVVIGSLRVKVFAILTAFWPVAYPRVKTTSPDPAAGIVMVPFPAAEIPVVSEATR